jgi:hypothetical protein
MRFRLLLRRLTISAPSMSVRSALPWPFRWAVIAIVMGFCAAIGLWAFEFGKDIAGLDRVSTAELVRLRTEVDEAHASLKSVQEERNQAQSVANTAATLVATAKASQEALLSQVKVLEAENGALRDDLGFFEKLIPAVNTQGIAIRSLQAELLQSSTRVKWQVLVLQPSRGAPEFSGRLELSFSGTLAGKPWSAPLVGGGIAIKIKQYGRWEGEFELPPQAVLKSVTAHVMEGAVVKSSQSIKL